MEKTIQMPTSQYEPMQGDNNGTLTCNECKTQFQKPIIATLTCQTGTQKYYACPHCLAEIPYIDQPKSPKHQQTKPEETPKSNPSTVTTTTTTEQNTQTTCTHAIGYLRTRPKNTPIPEECLTCDKMVDCMLH
jgi:hypothetical protein